MRSARAKRKRPLRRVSGPVVNQVVCVGRAAGGRWPDSIAAEASLP